MSEKLRLLLKASFPSVLSLYQTHNTNGSCKVAKFCAVCSAATTATTSFKLSLLLIVIEDFFCIKFSSRRGQKVAALQHFGEFFATVEEDQEEGKSLFNNDNKFIWSFLS